MAVDEDGRIEGSVSGGCVEGAVVSEAMDCLQHASSRRLKFGVTDEQAWEVGLSCGGSLEILVEPLVPDWWRTVVEGLTRETSLACVSHLAGESPGERAVVNPEGEVLWQQEGLPAPELAPLQDLAQQALSDAGDWREAASRREVFIDRLLPRPRLILIGGAHVAVALQSMARRLGFRVVLIDPRRAFATPERFPDVEAIHHEYPQKVLPSLGLDAESYVAVLTHDPKIDDPALLEALPSPAPYVGVLSSRRTHQKRLARLRERGLDDASLERIHTPIGLDIGARTPEEIALAILAEIVAVRRRG